MMQADGFYHRLTTSSLTVVLSLMFVLKISFPMEKINGIFTYKIFYDVWLYWHQICYTTHLNASFWMYANKNFLQNNSFNLVCSSDKILLGFRTIGILYTCIFDYFYGALFLSLASLVHIYLYCMENISLDIMLNIFFSVPLKNKKVVQVGTKWV